MPDQPVKTPISSASRGCFSATSARRKAPSSGPTDICASGRCEVSSPSRRSTSVGGEVIASAYSSDTADQNAPVVAAEPHRVRERDVDLDASGLVRHVVEV